MKVQKMVGDIELEEKGEATRGTIKMKTGYYPSLADCWRWLKGLLFDFISLKKMQGKKDKLVAKANRTID